MSQEGSVIGNRLGISKNWTADFGNYGYKEKLNKTIFLREWMRRMIKRFSIWLLAMQIVKQKNTYNIHVLCLYFPDTIPLVHNVYFSLRKQPHWYWVPTMSGFFNAPFDPPEPTRMGDTVTNIACKF